MARERSSTELEFAAGRISYEVQIFAQLPNLVVSYDRDGPAILKNACLESLTVHARSLIAFLGATAHHRPTDIVASDFLGDDASFFPRDRFVGWWDLISQYVLHLTYHGMPGSEPPPDYWMTDLVGGLLEEFASFASAASSRAAPYASTFAAATETAHIDFAQCRARWPPALPHP
jgi:hypothetical protein